MTDQIEINPPGSRLWWLARLGARLNARQKLMVQYDDYYNGNQPLAFASEKFVSTFGDRFPAFSSNFMSLVVDSHRERLHVQGVRFGEDQESDKDVWTWWNDNHLDSGSQILHQEALVMGISYGMVWPNDDGVPEFTIESPLQTVVETAPGKPWKRLAALRRYLGDDLHVHAELYLPGPDGGVFKYRSRQRDNEFSIVHWSFGVTLDWDVEKIAGEDWPIAMKIEDVPIVPFVNRPRLGPGDKLRERRDGQSEIAMVMSNQDAINKLRADALVSSEFAAFRQRWAIGVDIPTDPETGLPVETFRAAVDHLWTVPPPDPDDPNPAPVQFGEFEATDLAPYYAGIAVEVQHVGAITRTPYHYLLPQSGQPPSGESLKSAETGLVAKVRDSMLHKGEGWEEIVRLKFAWEGDERGDRTDIEVIWKDPESRTEAEHMDALVKLKSLGVSTDLILEMVPLSPQQIARNKRAIARDAVLAPVGSAPVVAPAAPAPVAPAPTVTPVPEPADITA
jgi:hypothetical protein